MTTKRITASATAGPPPSAKDDNGGIEDKMDEHLSGGGQRLLFGLALCGDPDLIFLDEPTVGLDIEARRGLWAEIRGLAARGKTVLLTTHYLAGAMHVAT